jgi:processive 1,2-diacylglycerol beta-glucosyltransferase
MRVLIVTADIGAGHDLPAALLADALRSRGASVLVTDGLAAGGRGAQAVARGGLETIVEHFPLIYDAQYALISRVALTREAGAWLAMGLGARGLLRLIRGFRPDVIVSTYPGTTEVLGRLRQLRRLSIPCVAAITDLAALRWWAHPGMDLHLITHEQSRAEVETITDGEIVHVRGFTRPEFEAPPAAGDARAALELPSGVPVVVVSGGGWGVGDLATATRTVLAVPDAVAVCLCGSNAGVRERLSAAFAGEPRVRVEGFTDRMCEWLAAADVLVHSTAGLTVLEAELCGTWAISYGWGHGHIRINNAAYRATGLAAVAASPAELSRCLADALRAPRPVPSWYAGLPEAADLVLGAGG